MQQYPLLVLKRKHNSLPLAGTCRSI
jgi:hypothetical protein